MRKNFLQVDDKNETNGSWGVADGNPFLSIFGKTEVSGFSLEFPNESEATLLVRANPDIVCRVSVSPKEAECQIVCEDRSLDSIAANTEISRLMSDGTQGSQVKILSSPDESTFTILEKSNDLRYIAGLLGTNQVARVGLYDDKQNLIWISRRSTK